MSEITVTVSGPVGCGKSAVLGEIENTLKALRIPVSYADELAHTQEVNLTHADWIDLLEMYNPTVILVEKHP